MPRGALADRRQFTLRRGSTGTLPVRLGTSLRPFTQDLFSKPISLTLQVCVLLGQLCAAAFAFRELLTQAANFAPERRMVEFLKTRSPEAVDRVALSGLAVQFLPDPDLSGVERHLMRSAHLFGGDPDGKHRGKFAQEIVGIGGESWEA